MYCDVILHNIDCGLASVFESVSFPTKTYNILPKLLSWKAHLSISNCNVFIKNYVRLLSSIRAQVSSLFCNLSEIFLIRRSENENHMTPKCNFLRAHAPFG